MSADFKPHPCTVVCPSMLLRWLDLSFLGYTLRGGLGVSVFLFWFYRSFFDGQYFLVLSYSLVVRICHRAVCEPFWLFGLL